MESRGGKRKLLTIGTVAALALTACEGASTETPPQTKSRPCTETLWTQPTTIATFPKDKIPDVAGRGTLVGKDLKALWGPAKDNLRKLEQEHPGKTPYSDIDYKAEDITTTARTDAFEAEREAARILSKPSTPVLTLHENWPTDDVHTGKGDPEIKIKILFKAGCDV